MAAVLAAIFQLFAGIFGGGEGGLSGISGLLGQFFGGGAT